MCCGQDLVNSSCKRLQISGGLSNCRLSKEQLLGHHTLVSLHQSDINDSIMAFTAQAPLALCVYIILFS